MYQKLTRTFSNNFYILIGILIGLYLSSLASFTIEPLCSTHKPAKSAPIRNEINQNFAPPKNPLPTMKKTSSTPKKSPSKIVRPRYYSTELGIRDKLFVGIFTSQEKIEDLVIPLNQTIQQVTTQAKFFITAQYKLMNKVNLTGLVGFTDTRPRYRPFQVIKYIGDNFLQDYDYYFLANDFTFVNSHKLNDLVAKISVSMDVYLGTKSSDASYCNLEAGIILSNSVLKAIRTHLDWCIINAITDDYSENLGRCIHHSIGLECQEQIQGQSLRSFKLKHFDLKPHLLQLSQKADFQAAVTIHPILQGQNFHLLNAFFLKHKLESIHAQIQFLSQNLNDEWPAGVKPSSKPLTRFDQTRQLYFNMSHVFFPDDFHNVRPHTEPESRDIAYILDEIKLKYVNSTQFQFRRLVNGYKTFDLARGMDYVLDLGFRNLQNGKEAVKRFEVCKPLGKVELLQVPYVTENTRVTILLPVEEHQAEQGLKFLQHFKRDIFDRKEKTFLMLVFLYQAESSAKGDADKFNQLKMVVQKIGQKYKMDDLKMAWLSIRLPPSERMVKLSEWPQLHFAYVDLALKKIGLDSLILTLSPFVQLSVEFLNRVRLNTIQNFQVFSPIPFRQYNPKVTQIEQVELNKNGGHFDREEYRFVSFYSKDYVNSRKQMKFPPIVRVDNDIAMLLTNDTRENSKNLFDMFVKNAKHLHGMRATEMGLRVKYNEEEERCNLFLGNKIQLGRLLLEWSANGKIPQLG